jgi:hypothetical protein
MPVGVLGEVDLAHAAGTDLAHDGVAGEGVTSVQRHGS